MDIGSKEWNLFYHGRNNRVKKNTDRAKRFRGQDTKKALNAHLDLMAEQAEIIESFDRFDLDLDQVSGRKKHRRDPETMNRVLNLLMGA